MSPRTNMKIITMSCTVGFSCGFFQIVNIHHNLLYNSFPNGHLLHLRRRNLQWENHRYPYYCWSPDCVQRCWVCFSHCKRNQPLPCSRWCWMSPVQVGFLLMRSASPLSRQGVWCCGCRRENYYSWLLRRSLDREWVRSPFINEWNQRFRQTDRERETNGVVEVFPRKKRIAIKKGWSEDRKRKSRDFRICNVTSGGASSSPLPLTLFPSNCILSVWTMDMQVFWDPILMIYIWIFKIYVKYYLFVCFQNSRKRSFFRSYRRLTPLAGHRLPRRVRRLREEIQRMGIIRKEVGQRTWSTIELRMR